MRNFESLRVWQNLRLFVNSIYDLMADNRDWGFRDQIQRAAVSIMNNIAKVMNLDLMPSILIF